MIQVRFYLLLFLFDPSFSEKSRCLHLHWFRQDSLAVASCEDAESCEEDVMLEVISLNFSSSSITRHGALVFSAMID